MNTLRKMAVAAAALLALAGCASGELERNFRNPPADVQTAVYWYWISGNISKQGVIDDLHAMQRAGINRAFIGNIGQDGLYTDRNVLMFSDEWWDILHTALRTAAELDIEIGIFNSPGWSQSGGPWIEPEQSMRYLASAFAEVHGPQSVEIAMAAPAPDFEDVRTIAFPAPAGYATSAATIVRPDESIRNLAELPAGCENVVYIDFARSDDAFAARSLTIHLALRPMNATAHVEALAGGEWRRIADCRIDRSNPALNVGFAPFAPVTVSFPATEASRFRLVIDPTGQAGGIERVELSAMPRIASYAEKTLAKMCQTPLPYWNHYMWPAPPALDDKSQAVDPAAVIDISECMSEDGTLKWEAPAGDWIVMRTGMTPTGVTNSPATPEATGLEVDKMSRRHVESHFDAFIGEILRRIPERDRSTFKVVVQDSYETGGQNITDGMIELFEQTYGYSMLPYLPAYYGYVVGDEQRSERFLWDLRRLVADRVAYDYVGGLKQVSNAHGLTTWLECYGHWGFPGEFLQYGGQSDEIGGEFWSVGSLGDIENRAASSCGHIYGKRKIWAESNTSGGPAYSRSPVDMKQRTDRFFAEGINATLLHLYIEQADTARYPGINAPFGNEFDAHNTWYSHMDLFTAYLKRCNYMLQQGLNVADVAYFIGEDAPKMTGEQSPALPSGYQFDYINAEVLLLDANVRHGEIVLPHGTSYRVLVLPPLDNMRPALLEKIRHMVADGAVVLGTPPHRSPSLENYPAADAEVEAMARELWGECYDSRGSHAYGKGRVFNGYTLEELFAATGTVPDFAAEQGAPLLYNHRTTTDAEIYFVSNQSDRAIDTAPEFRVDTSLRPELWDPTDGSVRALPQFEITDRGIRVPLHFDALGSGFVVFREGGAAAAAGENYPQPSHVASLDGPWDLSFEGKLSSPAPLRLDALADLSQSESADVRYFSGTIDYRTEFEMDGVPAGGVWLDLGRVECMAKVYVNDVYAGGAWCAPYKVDISSCVRSGRNTLRVEVVNKWVNRIVGDMQLPPEERSISLMVNPYNASSALSPSGLIGPVRVESYN